MGPPKQGGDNLPRTEVAQCRKETVLAVADLRETDPFRDRIFLGAAAVELGGIRSICCVPLVHETEVCGPFAIFRPGGAAVFGNAGHAGSVFLRRRLESMLCHCAARSNEAIPWWVRRWG
jgi:hypothetical protein